MSLKKKIGLVLVCLLLVSAAINDGAFSSFFILALLVALFILLPYGKAAKSVIIFIAFILVGLTSGYKTYSPFIYPVIGQKVVVNEDLPLQGIGTYRLYNQFFFDDNQRQILEQEGRSIEVRDMDHIPKGSIFYVDRIELDHGIGRTYYFIFSNGTEEFVVSQNELGGDSKEFEHRALCAKVEWEFCNTIKAWDDESYKSPSPMRNIFRILSLS